MASFEEQPEPYNMRDLTLDVRLKAIVDGEKRDYTGKEIFSVDFFRKGVGFGITNIDIEVNTSLQPIITITFKDLYGNTVFGRNNNDISDLNENGSNNDFSVLFNWPPPKFLFTFKGFLGRSSTWILNLKKTSTSYDSSDGSYDIKCEFVPNQWGFMADLPFLFLLAVKSLKKADNGNNQTTVQTIFDLIKIGKQVEVKTQETTKEFDNLLKQTSLLKSQRVYDAIFISKVINYDDLVSGAVGQKQVTGFHSIKIPTPTGAGNTNIDSPEKIKALVLSAENLRKLNAFLLLTTEFDGIPNNPKITFNDVSIVGGIITVPKIPDVDKEILRRQNILLDNITKIENAIKGSVYSSSKLQLQKITIGEVFKQLSKDAGYIMGRILDVGYEGFDANKEIRIANDKELIGRNFPMFLTADKQEEKPAIKAYGAPAVGVEEYEMAFVDKFIEAISEGIATELAEEKSASESVGSNYVKKRITNLEVLKENPYKPFYQSITENIMVRSAIAAYLISSTDPNKPGDYSTFFGVQNSSSAEDIAGLVEADFENISDSLIGQLSETDFKQLKDFCVFWNNFLTEDCDNFLRANNSGTFEEAEPVSSYLNAKFTKLDDFVMNYEVVLERPANWSDTSQINKNSSKGYNDATGLRVTTLKSVMLSVFRASASSNDSTNAVFVDAESLHAVKLINNGIAYYKPSGIDGVGTKTKYVFVAFGGSDANKTQEAASATSDSEIASDRDKQKDKSEPLGYVNIQNPFKPDDSAVLLDSVVEMNERIDDKLLLDYSRLTNPSSAFFKDSRQVTNIDELYFSVTKKYGNPNALAFGEQPATNVSFSVAFHPTNSDLIFGPFSNDAEGSSMHRGYIKKMCSKLLEKLNGVEQKRNDIISNALGKAGEQRDALYKQMHVIYHQWEVLMVKDSDSANGQNTVGVSKNSILKDLQDRYDNHVDVNISSQSTNIATDNSFLYGYPLNYKNNIIVKNSIINIEPLYKPNGSTTVLNIIQQICTKNNFIFIPMPGNAEAFSTSEIFSPHVHSDPQVNNFFYVQFAPTPESRSKLTNSNPSSLSDAPKLKDKIPPGTLNIKFGSPGNQIVKGISVDTQESKATAESIVNLQRLVDNENQNKTVTTDCSMLPVMEGRSYKANIDMIGNAQVFPMQFFYLDSNPLFNGLYQIMKVKHSIKPNDMTTSAEGIRMRMSYGNDGDFGGIPPITTDILEGLVSATTTVDISADFAQDDFDPNLNYGISETGGNKGNALMKNSDVTSKKVLLRDAQKANVNKLMGQMISAGIVNQYTQAAILSVVYKESSFIPKNENLNYSEKRILEVWPATPLQAAKDSANNPEKLGNLKYGGKYGNSPTEGYKFRGRGYNQITFKSAYEKYSNLIKVDLIADPDKLNTPTYAGQVAISFFRNGLPQLGSTLTNYYNNASHDINAFNTLEDAVGAIYHVNAGAGSKMEKILLDTTGGRKKAFSVSEFFLDVVKKGSAV